MCSFLVTNKDTSEEVLNAANFYQKFRGPDLTSYKNESGFHFIHNLLSITGDLTPQPLISKCGDIIMVFNGEIYNYKDITPDSLSDGESIIKAYEEYGAEFFKYLDGEFTIVLLDKKKKKLIFGSDTFGTKPIFFSIHNNTIGIASYKSALSVLGYKEIFHVYGNYYYTYDISNDNIKLNKITAFDLDNEHKVNLDDWKMAFDESILKRTVAASKKIFMGVSEGYDSGAICSALLKYNLPFKAYSVNVLEKPSNVLLWRHGLSTKNPPIIEGKQILIPNIVNKELIDPTDSMHEITRDEIFKNVEDYAYTHFDFYKNKFVGYVCRETYGFIGAGLIFLKAKKEGYKICLSGLGGDAIGFKGINKLFKRLKDINGVIDYDDNNPYSCEYCCGVHGIEVRYPYLDKKLWQETLWLDKSKYNNFKEPQRQYMLERQFPFVDVDTAGKEIYEKVGFCKKLPEDFFKV